MSNDTVERRKRSDAQEARWAKVIGGTVNAGSGSGRRRQDVRGDGSLWEMKRTDGKSISVKLSDLDQLRIHAIREDRTPYMHLEIGGYGGTKPVRLVVSFESDWLADQDV